MTFTQYKKTTPYANFVKSVKKTEFSCSINEVMEERRTQKEDYKNGCSTTSYDCEQYASIILTGDDGKTYRREVMLWIEENGDIGIFGNYWYKHYESSCLENSDWGKYYTRFRNNQKYLEETLLNSLWEYLSIDEENEYEYLGED